MSSDAFVSRNNSELILKKHFNQPLICNIHAEPKTIFQEIDITNTCFLSQHFLFLKELMSTELPMQKVLCTISGFNKDEGSFFIYAFPGVNPVSVVEDPIGTYTMVVENHYALLRASSLILRKCIVSKAGSSCS